VFAGGEFTSRGVALCTPAATLDRKQSAVACGVEYVCRDSWRFGLLNKRFNEEIEE